MTHTADNGAADLIDRLAGLAPGSATHTLRHQRETVAVATQRGYDALFDPALEGITPGERLCVACYAARLTPSATLLAHYRDALAAQSVDAAARAAIESGTAEDIAHLADKRLAAILTFTRTLIENPVAGDKAALHALPAAGLTTPAVVALAQLIAFLSYQTRVVAGLQALAQMEHAA